jgi:glycosyltransferase involved in cell wall biosynthesis
VKKQKILIIGHSAIPETGSEPGLTWNWAWEMSQFYRVILLTYPMKPKLVREYLANHDNPDLSIHWFPGSCRLDPWRQKRDHRTVRIHYWCWLKTVPREVDRILESEQIDLAHHVSWVSVGMPLAWKRWDIPFVWGPVGAAQKCALAHMKYFTTKDKLRELIRTVRIYSLPLSRTFRITAKRASLILTTNPETFRLVQGAGSRNIEMMFDNGISEDYFSKVEQALRCCDRKPPNNQIPLRLIWIGEFAPYKGFLLALDAAKILKNHHVAFELEVGGYGPEERRYSKSIHEAGLEKQITLIGRLSREQVIAKFRPPDLAP